MDKQTEKWADLKRMSFLVTAVALFFLIFSYFRDTEPRPVPDPVVISKEVMGPVRAPAKMKAE